MGLSIPSCFYENRSTRRLVILSRLCYADKKGKKLITVIDNELLELAKAEGFFASLTMPEQVPVNAKFRVYCEENRCGKYGANYSCPPDCGTVEELHQKILAEDKVLIVQTIWPISGYEDKAVIQKSKEVHNAMVLRLKAKMEQHGYAGFCSGYNGCPLCSPCKRTENQPCIHPDLRISCMSAYCIDVAELAKRCSLAFAWSHDKLHLFGMIAFHETEKKQA